MIGHDLLDSLSLGRLQSGGFKEYSITSRQIYGNPEVIELNINISYTDIFKKFKGKVDHICLIA